MKHFIYKTTNIINGKIYIGMHSTENINDGYLGSGTILKKAIKKYGKGNFKREILEFCNSLEELIESEKNYITENFIKDENNYNLKTGGQSCGILSNESKLKISNTLKKKYANGELIPRYTPPYIPTEEQKEKMSEILKEYYKNNPHHGIGTEPWNKNKKGVQEAWNKGIKTGPMDENQKEKISNTMKKWHYENDHPLLGTEPWNKGKKGVQEAWNKGKEMEKIECPYCGKLVDKGNGKRWHFDNCKNKAADNLC